MFKSNWLRVIVSTAFLVLVTQPGRGDEPAEKRAAGDKYQNLVRQLASPNKMPVTQEDSVKFPSEYDVEAQNRIDTARRTLRDNLMEALPYLVEALDDQRYCMTIDWAEGDAYYNKSVGAICRDIIRSQLEVYREEIRFSDAPHWNRYNYKPISKQWYAARKDRSLAEFQVEAIDWAIVLRRAEPKEEVAPDRKSEIINLERLRDEIARTGKPAKARSMLRMVTRDR